MENFISIIGLLGLGGILGGYLNIIWERRKNTDFKKHEFKESRYKVIILLMYSALDFEKRNENLKKFRDFNSKAELIEELKAEWNNALLFASKAVIIDFQKFILKQDQKNYFETILSMRNDLYGGKNKIQINDLKL